MYRLIALLGGGLMACGGGGESADAAASPCEGGQPGVRVHLSFDPPGSGGSPSWQAQDLPLNVTTTGGGTQNYLVEPAVLDANRQGTISVAYPVGTITGSASVGFYAIAAGLTQWEGEGATFAADPSACVDVDLAVHFVDIAPDAGL